MSKEKQVEANIATTKRKFSRGSSSKTKVGPSKPNAQINKKGNGKTLKKNKRKKVAKKCKCYRSSQHWLRNCPKYLAEEKTKKETQDKYDLLVVETCLVKYENSTWILDSEAINHICFSLQKNSCWKKVSKCEITLKVGTGEIVSAKSVGDLKLYFINRYVILKNVLLYLKWEEI